jgi:hypothetical protein
VSIICVQSMPKMPGGDEKKEESAESKEEAAEQVGLHGPRQSGRACGAGMSSGAQAEQSKSQGPAELVGIQGRWQRSLSLQGPVEKVGLQGRRQSR